MCSLSVAGKALLARGFTGSADLLAALCVSCSDGPESNLKELYYCPSGGLYACNWMGTYFAMGSTGSGDEVGQCILDDLFVPKLI